MYFSLDNFDHSHQIFFLSRIVCVFRVICVGGRMCIMYMRRCVCYSKWQKQNLNFGTECLRVCVCATTN